MRRINRFIALFLLLIPLVLMVSVPALAASPLTLPAGFTDEAAYNGLLAPRAFTFTQDGRVLALERGSATSNDSNFSSVRVFKNGALLPTRAYTLNTCGDAERGALGIVTDPNFVTNGYIYIYYTRQATTGSACGYNTFTNGDTTGPRNRISRFTMSGDVVVAGSERVLIDSIVTDIGYHNAGDVHFGLDGYLYASSGEGGLSWTSADIGTLNGKIIRILPTPGAAGGYTTTGNPYDTAVGARNCATPASIGAQGTSTGPCKEIFAKGFRNPFRFNIQPNLAGISGTGSPVVGDVGGGAWEEIDQVRSGGDYGHPVREGYCPGGVVCPPPYQSGGQVAGYDNPIYAYPHAVVNANFDSAVIGGDFYTGGASFPSDYLNNYFFVDFARGFVGRLIYSGGQWTRSAQDFGSGGNAIIGFQRGPDGNLYYLTFASETDRTDSIRRIRYSASQNQAPVAQASVSPQSGPLNTVYTFSASGSVDPDGNTPLTYKWDFGDGSTVTTTNLTVTHTYTQSANRTASLTVTDSGNPAATSAPATVNVFPANSPPSGSIVLTNLTDASRTTTFYAGDTWAYSAANVSDDETLPANAINWEIVFHHQQHTHPFLPFLDGASGQFTLPNTGELDPVVWYRVHMYITDARGQRTEVVKDILPVTTNLTFNTNPAGGQVTIEGATFPTPLNITRVVGMRFSADVPSPQTIGSSAYTFNNWSQGGTQLQTITVPPVNTTYTANLDLVAPTVTLTPSLTLTPTPTPNSGQTQTITVQVASAVDDANELAGVVTTNSTSAWVGNGGSATASYLGLRFNNLPIPQGAVITSADLQFYSSQSQWIGLTAEIAAETGNAQPFNITAPSLRNLTVARVTHNTNAQWLANTWYSFGLVNNLVQEVVNRPGWNTGSSLALIVHGTGGTWSRKFFTPFDSNPANAPRLLITFNGGSPVVPSITPSPTFTPTFTASFTPVDPIISTATLTPTATSTSTSTPTATVTNTPTPTLTSTPVPVSGTFMRQVTVGSDDVNQDGTALQASTTTVWIGNASTTANSYSAFRFTNIQVPRGATITAARLEFYSASNQWVSINLLIAGDAADNSAPFSASALPSQRPLTTARVTHTSDVNWAANTWYPFTDMRLVVQEIINRPNWQAGNTMSIILTGTGAPWGRKSVSSFERGATFAPRLVITYTS